MDAADSPAILTQRLVRKGIALLDQYGPTGWRDRIDGDTLNMGDVTLCVIAQAYTPEWRKAREAHEAIVSALIASPSEEPWPEGPAATPYHYGAELLYVAAGYEGNGSLTKIEVMRACGFTALYVAAETLRHAWLQELSK